MRTAAVLWSVLAGSLLLCGAAQANKADEVLQDIQEDARRDVENSARNALSKRFPYSGTLYGLPGQQRSDSIREAAIRAAIGGMFGSCKVPGGKVDLGKLPGGLNMDVSGILANTTVQVPTIPDARNNQSVLTGNSALGSAGSSLSGSSALGAQASALIPQPTEVANGQVKVNGTWMPIKDYQRLTAETQSALNQALQQQAQADGRAQVDSAKQHVQQPRPKQIQQSPAVPQRPAVSKIWAAPAKQ